MKGEKYWVLMSMRMGKMMGMMMSQEKDMTTFDWMFVFFYCKLILN